MSRDYKHEYATYHGKPEQRKRRSARNKARSLLIKKGVAKKGDGKDVDHKDRNTSNNKTKNLRVTSRKTNRSRNGRKKS